MAATNARDRWRENPFYVLGLRPDCSRMDVEREGHKLLAMLQLGLAAAQKYRTPLGEMPRTPEAVRFAMAELRDPLKRLEYEIWAQLPPDAEVKPSETRSRPAPWVGARRLLGWGA
jgi:hypothetical protein